ncbi:hypothetical protein K1719_041029 [Acacia pycnantha]|nr:hypothetical protein K1719_041029 [Acacia pycnantha]
MIRKGWGLDRWLEIHDMPEKNSYLFRFGRQEDFDRVLKGRPWAIRAVLLNIQHWDDLMILREVNFQWCPFWVQFHGLPHGAFDSDNGVRLGNAIGRTVLFEAPRVHDRLSRTFIKVRVLVNILEPLTSGFWVPRPQRETSWVTVRICKFQAELSVEDDDNNQLGSGLGTVHVKTIDDALVVYDGTWDEAAIAMFSFLCATGLPG